MSKDPVLTEEKRKQLDGNIRSMLEKGASKDDVIAYTKDFKAKFGSGEGEPVNFTKGSSEPQEQPTTTSSQQVSSEQQEEVGQTPTKPSVLVEEELPVGVASVETIEERNPYERLKGDLLTNAQSAISEIANNEIVPLYKRREDKLAQELSPFIKDKQELLQSRLERGEITEEEANKQLELYIKDTNEKINQRLLIDPEIKATYRAAIKPVQDKLERDLNAANKMQFVSNQTRLQALRQEELDSKGYFEGIGDFIYNEFIKSKMMPTQIAQVASQITEDIESDEPSPNIVWGEGGLSIEDMTPAQRQQYSLKATEKMREELRPTKEIINSWEKGDYEGVATAATGTALSFAGSIVRAIATRGLSIGGEVIEPMWAEAVVAKAEQEGKSIEQILAEDSEDELTAIGLGIAATALERAGIKAGKGMISKALSAAPKSKIVSSSAKETATELGQGYIEILNQRLQQEGTSIASTDGAKKALEQISNYFTSPEAAETAVSTLVGSAILGSAAKGGGMVANAVANKKPNEDVVTKLPTPAIEDIINDPDASRAQISKLFTEGYITPQQKKDAENVINEVEIINSKLKDDNPAKAESVKLIKEREQIQNNLEKLDETQREGEQLKVDKINERLKAIANDQQQQTQESEEGTLRDRQQPTQEEAQDSEVSEETQEGGGAEQAQLPTEDGARGTQDLQSAEVTPLPERLKTPRVARVGSTFDKALRGERINEKEINQAQQVLLDELEAVENSNAPQNIKDQVAAEIERAFNELENYEFTTETKTRTTTQKKPARVVRESVREQTKSPQERLLNREVKRVDGTDFTQEGFTPQDGTTTVLEEQDGTLVLQEFDETGKRTTSQPLTAKNVSDLELVETIKNENGNVIGATVKNKNNDGEVFSFMDEDLALDFAIEKTKAEVGEMTFEEELLFEQYEELKPKKDAVQKRKAEEVPMGEQAQPSEEVVGEVREQTETPTEATQEEVEVETPTPEAKRRAKQFGFSSPVEARRAARKHLGKPEDVKIEDLTDSELTEIQSRRKADEVQQASTELSQAWNKWKERQRNVGIAFDPKSKAQEDVELLRAATKFVYAKVAEGAYNAKKFAKDLLDMGVEVSNPDKLYNFVTTQRKNNLKDITKKVKRVGKKLRGGEFYNRSIDVANFIGSLSNLGAITDPQVIEDVNNQLDDLLQRGIAKVDQKAINEVTSKVQNSERVKDTRTAKQKANSKIRSLRSRSKGDSAPNNFTSLLSFMVTAEEAKSELDNALTNGQITEEEYDAKMEDINGLVSDVESISPQTPNSYAALIREKGNITRTKNRINKALEDGKITQQKANELLDGLELAAEQYAQDQKEFIKENNKKVRDYFKSVRSTDVRDIFNLSKPQFILIDKLFDVFKRADVNIEDPVLSDKLSKIVDAIDSGYFPLKDIYEAYRYVLSEKNANDVVDVLDKATADFKDKSTEEILRDFSATVLGFRSAKLGKDVKKSKVIERTVFAPLLEAIEQSEQATEEILSEFDKATKMSFFDKLNPFKKAKRRRNIILAGVYMNQLNNYLQRGEGNITSVLIKQVDNSKLDVGSIDWLGIILGKEAAVNALEGDLNPTTREAILNGELRKEYGKLDDLKYMEEVWASLPKNEDGSVDWDDFFNNVNNHLDQEARGLVMASNKAFADSYEYAKTAKYMRGERVDEVVGYYKRARKGIQNADIDYRTVNFTDNMRVVAGSAIDRTTQAVGAIDFNVINTVVANAIESTKFFNFEINGGLVNSTLGRALNKTPLKQAVAALKDDARQSINFTYNSKGGKVEGLMSKLIGAKYVEALFKIPRLAAELISMVVRMPWQTGTLSSFGALTKTKTLGALESISGIKLTPTQSAQIEQGGYSSMKKRSRRTLSALRGRGAAEYLGMAMGSAELLLRAGYTYPLFLKNFEMIAGDTFNSDRLSDPQYIQDNRQAITDAMAITKIENGRLYPTGSKFAERRKVKLVPYFKTGYVDADSWFGRLMNYMSTFVFKESETLGETVRYTRDIFNKEGFTGKGVKKAASQVFYSKETAAGVGVLIGGFIYSYITGLDYLLSRLWDDDSDDEEKELAAQTLKEQYGFYFDKGGSFKRYDMEDDLKGSAEILAGQALFFGIGRYGQGIRIMTILGLSAIHENIRDQKTKEYIEGFLSNQFFTQPVKMSKFSLSSFASKNIPVVDMGINVFVDIVDATDEAITLTKKAVTGKISEEEQVFLRTFNIFFKAFNIALLKRGIQTPEKRRTERAIEQELKRGDKSPRKDASGLSETERQYLREIYGQ